MRYYILLIILLSSGNLYCQVKYSVNFQFSALNTIPISKAQNSSIYLQSRKSLLIGLQPEIQFKNFSIRSGIRLVNRKYEVSFPYRINTFDSAIRTIVLTGRQLTVPLHAVIKLGNISNLNFNIFAGPIIDINPYKHKSETFSPEQQKLYSVYAVEANSRVNISGEAGIGMRVNNAEMGLLELGFSINNCFYQQPKVHYLVKAPFFMDNEIETLELSLLYLSFDIRWFFLNRTLT